MICYNHVQMVLLHSQSLSVNWEAEDFALKDTDAKIRTLADFKDRKGLLVVFTCNHCPYAKAAWPVLINLYHKYANEIAFVAINPNDSLQYPEDSFVAMQQKTKEWQIPFPYLRDKTQAVAKAYQAQCTPDPYLFKNVNGSLRLFYHGRINDNWQYPENVKEENLQAAMTRLLAGQPSPSNQPPSMGCSIKWRN